MRRRTNRRPFKSLRDTPSGDLDPRWSEAAVSAYSSSFTVGAVTSVDSFTPYSGATVASLSMLSSGPELVIVVPSAGKVYHVAITTSNSMPDDVHALYTGASYTL